MSSWGGTRKFLNPNEEIAYRQPLPEGKFIRKTQPATVVSAYYEFPSKNSPEKYHTWIRNFLENIPCHLVFFTDNQSVSLINDCRKNHMDKTRIIILDKSEWVANTLIPQTVWDDALTKDPERDIHTTDLYKVWYEKKEFLRRAIKLNPFNHVDFVWADAGICRNESFAKLIKDFPNPSRIPLDRVMLLNLKPFTKGDIFVTKYANCQITGNFTMKNRIGGGIIAGPATNLLEWAKLYDSVFDKYVSVGRFVGKDQSIMATVLLENKHKFTLIETKAIIPDAWFYLLFYLGVSNKLFEYLSKPAANFQQSYDNLVQSFI